MAGFACQKRRLRNSVVGYPVSSVAPLVTNMLLFSDLLRQAVIVEGAVEGGVRR